MVLALGLGQLLRGGIRLGSAGQASGKSSCPSLSQSLEVVGPGGNACDVGQASAQKRGLHTPKWTGNKIPPEGGAAMEQKWEVASRTWGRRVRAKVLQAGKEAKDLQTELTPTGLGWALRELRSDSFFNLFFSSRGNLS